jgi:hypothetical protein
VMSNVSTGIAATVTGIRVGHRFDSMESRERNISENYLTRSLAAPAELVRDRLNRAIE